MRRKKPPRSLDAIEQLSGIIAHELNNIAVPLSGFVELVADNLHDAAAIRQCLEEVRISKERLMEMADDLQDIAESQAVRSMTTIAECVAMIEIQNTAHLKRISWACDPATPVAVDLLHAQRAVRGITQLSRDGSEIVIGRSLPGRTACAACGAKLRPSKLLIQVQVTGVREPMVTAVRNPFDAGNKIRTVHRLSIAAFIKAAHLAGGHVVASERTGSVSVTLPKSLTP